MRRGGLPKRLPPWRGQRLSGPLPRSSTRLPERSPSDFEQELTQAREEFTLRVAVCDTLQLDLCRGVLTRVPWLAAVMSAEQVLGCWQKIEGFRASRLCFYAPPATLSMLAAVAGVLGLALTSATDAAEQARRPQDRSWRGARARVARRGRGRRGRGARPSTGPRDASVWVTPRPAGSAAQRQAACHGRGVLHLRLDECRCSAGWAGRWCEERDARRCNAPVNPRQDLFNRESLCAGHCDEDRGICYCAGLATPTQRPLPFQCRPEAHLTTRLPDGRPAYPALTQSGRWEMARVYFETDRASSDYGWHAAGSR